MGQTQTKKTSTSNNRPTYVSSIDIQKFWKSIPSLIIIDSNGRTMMASREWTNKQCEELTRLVDIDRVDRIGTSGIWDNTESILKLRALHGIIKDVDSKIYNWYLDKDNIQPYDNVLLYQLYCESYPQPSYSCVDFTEQLIKMKHRIVVCRHTTIEQMRALAQEYDAMNVPSVPDKSKLPSAPDINPKNAYLN